MKGVKSSENIALVREKKKKTEKKKQRDFVPTFIMNKDKKEETCLVEFPVYSLLVYVPRNKLT